MPSSNVKIRTIVKCTLCVCAFHYDPDFNLPPKSKIAYL